MDDWLIRLKNEIRDLKTSHKKKSLMKAYYAQVAVSLPVPYQATAVRVTYADGDQPIITAFSASATDEQDIIPFAVNGNTQDFYFALPFENSWGGNTGKLYFLSTREITNIEQVSL